MLLEGVVVSTGTGSIVALVEDSVLLAAGVSTIMTGVSTGVVLSLSLVWFCVS